METVYFKAIILAFVTLIVFFISAVMICAFASGSRILRLRTKVKADHVLIELMEKERQQHLHIIRIYAHNHLSFLRHLN